MNSRALQKFRHHLGNAIPQHGLWVTLEAPAVTEIAVALGLDWVVIDAEHGQQDWHDLVGHIRAAVRSETVVLVRLAENSEGLIKRALDIGADGIVIPRIETAEELERAIQSATYPPRGRRGIGAERATGWGQCLAEHVKEAEDVLVVPIIESVEGVRNASALAKVERSSVFFFGPADLSATAGFAGEWEGEGVPAMIADARNALLSAGKTCGIIGRNHEDVLARYEQGFRMIGLGLDAGLLIRGLRESLGALNRDRKILPGLWIRDDHSSCEEACLPRPAESFRPNRTECMNLLAQATPVEISEGVTFRPQVGKHNGAVNLTTAIVDFAPQAILPYHVHTYAESITLLAGEVLVEVAGRCYALHPLDNISIPAGIPHRATNLSKTASARLHVAMNTAEPARTLTADTFTRRTMPSVSGTYPSAERFTSFANSKRYEPGCNASFIDYFNSDLIPGFGMSGGYGLFQPGGRLPAHLHDYDESICIVEGTAICRVEGRDYELSDMCTALQPRGRVHYFVNDSKAPMGMIWVYAGALPQRIVVAEPNAGVRNHAWADSALS